jgi:hypothetical protein
VEFSELGRRDASLPRLTGTSASINWRVDFGVLRRGGAVRLRLSATLESAEGIRRASRLQRTELLPADNPTAAKVRKLLAAAAGQATEPTLPAILLRALAYHATTHGNDAPAASAYMPFELVGSGEPSPLALAFRDRAAAMTRPVME